MSEPPVEAHPDGVQARPARIGQRWLDLSIAGVAIVISLISLAVGFYNAQSQQRMVAATSWPFLVYNTRQVSDRLTLRFQNEGVGPARLKRSSFATTAARRMGLYSSCKSVATSCRRTSARWAALSGRAVPPDSTGLENISIS